MPSSPLPLAQFGSVVEQTGRPPLRLLVGAQLAEEVDAARDAGGFVEVASSALALALQPVERSVALVLVDRSLPDLSWKVVSQVSERWSEQAPVVFVSHAQIIRIVKLWRDTAEHAGRREQLYLSALAAAFPNWNQTAPVALNETAGETAAAALPTDPWSMLVRPRTAEEDAAAKRNVLEASFRERERLLVGSLSTQQVANLLGVTRQTPHDRVKAKKLLAVEDKGELRFPLWQFDADAAGGVVRGLPEVLKVLGVSELAQARWLERPNPVFEGRSPLDALKAGEIERVVREARGIGAAAGHG